MRPLNVFNHVSLDGYFTDPDGDFRWAHAAADDAEWNQFVVENVQRGDALLFGRMTYTLMAGFWPTPAAAAMDPIVAEHINTMKKYVASRTLETVGWHNATLLQGDLVGAVRQLKDRDGGPITVLGSGSLVPQLAVAGLIDCYEIVVNPVALGAGRTLFDGLPSRVALRLLDTRAFANGKVLLRYEPAA